MLLRKENIKDILSILAEGREVFVPGLVRDMKQFRLWEGEEPLLDGENTVLPPKDILFPKTEKMYSYKTGDDAEISEIVESPARAVFGLRPCDARSIECMDSMFIREGYRDSFYARRRGKCLIIAVSCPGAGENCFCEAMGIDPNAAPGADIFLSDCGESFAVFAQTDAGRAELERWSEYLVPGESAGRTETHCSLHPKMSPELGARLEKMFNNDEFWTEVSAPCYHCGTCSFVCPTCYCFDINDENVGDEGVAFRCWDSCMFADYNQNAGGHNTRPTKKEKLRNRYMHKLAYFYDRHGMELCVGCGRCIQKCPAHLDIAEFIDKAAEVCYD
jgi:sulfhydrogenase subunit beta (sulfur reductase)